MNPLIKNILFFTVMMLAVLAVKWISGFEVAVLFALVEIMVLLNDKSGK
ncbi:hypothetical protein VNN41_10060 [Lactococcus garvieae]